MHQRTRDREELPPLLPAFARRRRAVQRAVLMAHGDMRYLLAVHRGRRAMEAGAWEKALGHFDRALGLYPLGPGYLIARGHAYRKLGIFEKAELDFRQALALGAPRFDLVDHIAHCAAETGWHQPSYPSSIIWKLEPAPDNRLQVGRAAFHLGLTTRDDVETALIAFFGAQHRENPLFWLRRYPTLDALLAALLRDPGMRGRERERPVLAGVPS